MAVEVFIRSKIAAETPEAVAGLDVPATAAAVQSLRLERAGYPDA